MDNQKGINRGQIYRERSSGKEKGSAKDARIRKKELKGKMSPGLEG